MNKSLGQITSMTLFVDHPLKMNFTEIQLNQFNVMVGMNGVGKSFTLVTSWVATNIANILIATQLKEDPIPIAQKITEGAYYAPVTGVLKVRFTSSVAIDIALDKGKVISCTYNGLDDVTEGTNCVYMSSSFRSFTTISSYLSVRKPFMVDIPKMYEELEKHFRLYDIQYVEMLINKMPLTVDKKLKEHFDKFEIGKSPMDGPILSIDVDYDKCDFYTIVGGKYAGRRSLSNFYGSGHQALINMILGGHNP